MLSSFGREEAGLASLRCLALVSLDVYSTLYFFGAWMFVGGYFVEMVGNIEASGESGVLDLRIQQEGGWGRILSLLPAWAT